MLHFKKAYRLFFLTSFYILVFVTKLFCQEKALGTVLRGNKIGKTYTFDSSTRDGYDKISVRYLGSVKTLKDEQLKVLTWARVWGQNHHTVGIVYIYNGNNQYVGLYKLGSMYDLPCKIENGKLIFIQPSKSNCSPKQRTEIDLTNGIPNQLFIKCRESNGDLYPFSTEQ